MTGNSRESWNTKINNFLESVSGGQLASMTMKTYRERFKNISNYFCKKELSIQCLNKANSIYRFVDHMLETNLSQQTVYHNISCLRMFSKYLFTEEIIKDLPKIDIEIGRKPPRILGFKEIDLVFSSLSWKEEIKTRAIFELLYCTGIRVSELINLKTSDININENTLIVINEHNKRTVPLHLNQRNGLPTVKETIKTYLKDVRPGLFKKNGYENLFLTRTGRVYKRENIFMLVKNVCEHAGLEINISPQDLRSSLILHMLENDVDMNVIKETLGLSSYFMFFNYLHLLDKSKMQKYRKILRHVHNDYK